MPDSTEIERQIREMLLDMGEDQLLAKLEGNLRGMDECDCRLSQTMEDMLQEVDRLLLKMDEIEADALEAGKENEKCIR
ncbi:MAG: hypothetical protein NTW84_04080 [Methanothrix sp.]|jgi:hypothetical protein|nr:hypothetical protein [Methanothrix sp.]